VITKIRKAQTIFTYEQEKELERISRKKEKDKG